MRTCEHKGCSWPVWGTDKKTRIGYCKSHQYLRTDTDKRSSVQKAMEMAKEIKKGYEEISEDAKLEVWFMQRRKEMTGICRHCGGVSCKDSDRYYKHSIAHILPKKLFISVATHPKNWIELCFWAPSCHTNFDTHKLDIIQLNCFDEVIEKFVAMYPAIDKKERRLIPEALLQYINI